MFWVLCCEVHYDFHIKTMFSLSLSPVVIELMSYLCYLYLFAYSGQHVHRFFHHNVPFYLHFWGYIQIFGGAMYPLTLHSGVQRKWTAFSPCKVVHHAVFGKYYAELAKTFFFLSDIRSDRKWDSVWPMAFVSVPPFLVILYITCQILFFIQNWMQDYLYIVMIIKQLH